MKHSPQIIILGGGPAGMGVGYYCYKNKIKFKLFEMSSEVGGNCKTFRYHNFKYDSGAHRFHDKDNQTTKDIISIMGEDLNKIEVPSQIYLKNRYIDFPLSPWNLVKFLGLKDSFTEFAKLLYIKAKNSDKDFKNFEEFAINTYGKKLANLFLLGYSEKLWGLPCSKLSTEIAGKRLKGLNLTTLILEILGLKNKKTKHLDGEFYYPKEGIGSIFQKMMLKTDKKNYFLENEVTKIEHSNNFIKNIETNGEGVHDVDYLVSSLSLDIIGRIMEPKIPKIVSNSIKSIKYRDLILVTFFLDKKNINRNGSMYFPSNSFSFTRIYEAKNRSKNMSPLNKTSLSVEIPTYSDSTLWNQTNIKIQEKITQELMNLNLFNEKNIIDIKINRISKAYPILDNNYKNHIDVIMKYFSQFKNLRINGRNGKFKYTHIHDHIKDARNIVENLKNNFI